MKHFLLLFAVLAVKLATAQVGINTTSPHASSMLDITASDKGMLVPRISLGNVNISTLDGINTAATGLLIWNTNPGTVGGNGSGFYYYNGTVWIPIKQTATTDTDFFEVGSTLPPNDIADSKYTMGRTNFGDNSVASAVVEINSDSFLPDLALNTTYTGQAVAAEIDASGTSLTKKGIDITFSGATTNFGGANSFIKTLDQMDNGTVNGFGLYQQFAGSGSDYTGVRNWFSNASNYTGNLTGISNYMAADAPGNQYGVYTTYAGSGSGDKYGTYQYIPSSSGGIHYGVYSNATSASGYAGYFLGRVSIGTLPTNNYLFPSSRGSAGQTLQTDASGNLSWVTPAASTDDQNLLTPTLTGTTLNLGIEGGSGASVNLSALQDGTGTDDQTIDNFSLSGTTLRLSLENDGMPLQTVNLASLQDGTGTDDQNLLTPTLTGTTLNLGIEGGSGTSVNLAALQDGTGTDDQNLGTATLTGTTLSVGIENGSGTSVDLAGLRDQDWYEVGSTNPPNSINDYKYTLGRLNIGNNSTPAAIVQIGNTGLDPNLVLENTGSSVNAQALKVTESGTSTFKTAVDLSFSGSTSGNGGVNSFIKVLDDQNAGLVNNTSIYQQFQGSGTNYNGLRNWFPSSGNYSGDLAGVYNTLQSNTAASQTGTFTSISGSGTGSKYGERIYIFNTAGGTHYGLYSEVLNANGFAGYFLGKVAIGTATGNIYRFPSSRGTNGQLMQTDSAGNVSWVSPSSVFTESSDWTTTGNAGSNPAVNFIGTTDNNDLAFRTNNVEKLRITSKGQLETTQLQSVWIGQNAGQNASGLRNTFVGHSSGSATTSGGDNTAIGGLALMSNITGIDNTAIGLGSLSDLANGSGNTALGEQSLENLAAGNYNVAIGHLSGENATGSSNVFIGYSSGQNSSGSNKLFIENSSANENNALLYGEFDNDILRTNGEFQVQQNSTGTASHIRLSEAGANDGARIRFENAAETTNSWVLYGRADDTPTDGRFNIFSSVSGNVVQLTSDGKVGINRTPASNDLEVNGTASKATAGSWLANSDRRLKKNIATIAPEKALEKLLRLRGVTYEWDDDKTGTERPETIQYGFIAQEIEQVFPDKVSEDGQGYLQTAYGDYDALIVQSLKALLARVERLEAENKELRSAVNQGAGLEASRR